MQQRYNFKVNTKQSKSSLVTESCTSSSHTFEFSELHSGSFNVLVSLLSLAIDSLIKPPDELYIYQWCVLYVYTYC